MKIISTLLLACCGLVSMAQDTQLLRQPSISNTEVVFVYANDLWKTSINGGNATRLTSNDGYEQNPHFSPDGKWIAFTAEYDGNVDVYVMPSEGGEPKRLTYHPDGDYVQGWTPKGEILFRSGRDSKPTQTTKFYTVNPKGSFPKVIDLERAAYGDISEDGKYIAYTPIMSWDAEWRNYRGGQAMPIWIVDLKTKELITTPQKDKERHLDPIWLDSDVYYLSERDYTSNIWRFNVKTKTEEQITFHKKFDVKSLDAHNDKIIYEQGGYLHVIDLTSKTTKQLDINVAGDLSFSRPRWENVTANNLINGNISPTGKRALFEYRGEIFSIPKKDGSWINLTNSPGSADRYPVWSPKGDKIAWFSDTSGEYQLSIVDQNGQNQIQIPLPNPTFYFRPDWSPDGKHLAFTDTDYNIWIVNLETKKVTKADTDRYAHPNRSMNPVWSPDSQWIAYAKQLDSHFKAVFVYNITTNKNYQITDGIADVISPVWDESGDYIYTLGSTNYGLSTGWLDMSSYDPKTVRSLYAIVLSKTGKAPNLPKNDMEAASESDKDKKKDEKETAIDVKIDVEGILDRVIPLKLEAREYMMLAAGPKHKVFVAEQVPNERNLLLHNYDVAEEKATEFAKGVQSMTTSADRKNILLKQNGSWLIVDTKSSPKPGDGKLDTNIKMLVDPKAEYHQMFKEGWRFMRDFLYVNNVHGAPWDKVYEWYSPWIDHVRHRTDLNYVIDIMSGEVAIGHSYVSGGDMPDVERVQVGLLGCDYVIKNNHYQISKIYDGERWNPNIEAPLGLPGIDVKEGDYILAVNGKSFTAEQNIYHLFEQTAGRTTQITVNSKPNLSDARVITVKPVNNERALRTIDWVEGNRRRVDELSKGQLAYVYVPNTSNPGFTSFNRYYFAQQDKKGVIVDERNNGGGSAADYMIDIMSRELFGYFNSRTEGNRPWTTPMAGIWGPKVMLINERAGSGGDLLPYMFRAKNLGPLVGTRTWGGLVGTWDTPRLLDGGRMVAPRGGFYDAEGNWAVEAEGVAPDIEVIQHPKLTSEGRDPQLERGVEEALRLLKENPFQLKPEPSPPVRWKRPAGYENED